MVDLDLFAGARGWEARSDGLDIDALGIEIDESACRTSQAAGYRTHRADVSKLDPYAFDGIRGLIASPPCQTFSIAGRGAGRQALDTVLAAIKAIGAGKWPSTLIDSTGDARTALVLQPLRYALAARPQWMAWEQVPTVLPVWRACADVLAEHGYRVDIGILRAEQYGVPQTRRRAVLIGHRDRSVHLPAPTHSRYHNRTPEKIDAGLQRWISMADVLGWDGDLGVMSNYGTGGDASARGIRMADQPAATVTSKIDRYRVLRNGNQAHACVRRIDQPAGTIYFGQRANWMAWQDEAAIRKITRAEAATLQTFPHAYPFAGTKTSVLLQIGNAIPPLLARAVLAPLVDA